MAEVYEANDGAGRAGVIKRIRPDQRTNPAFLALLATEAAALRRIDHAAVIRLLDEGAGWLVLEPSAERTSWPGPADRAPLVSVLDRLAAGLVAVHAAGVLHRDVKVDNVLSMARGPVLADFGAARIDGRPDPAPGLGSPEAMAPERLAGQDATAASDWFAFGVLAYTLVRGTPPWPAGRFAAQRAVRDVPLSRLGDDDFANRVHRLLDDDPARRGRW